MIHFLETVAAAAAGSGTLLTTVRGLWWGACVAAGEYAGAQQGQTLSEREAFELGRGHVIQTIAMAGKGALDRIDWKSVGAGLLLARADFHKHALIFLRGRVRDCRVAWLHVVSFVRRKPTLHPDTRATLTNIENARKSGLPVDALAAIVASNIEGLHMRLKVLANKDNRTRDEIYEHEHIKAQLAAHYEQEPALGMQPLLGVPVAGFSLAPWALGGVALMVSAFGVQTLRVHNLKADNNEMRAEAKTYRENTKARDVRIATLSADVSKLGVTCVAEQKAAADRVALRYESKARAETKARRITNDAASRSGSQPFDLGARLHELEDTGPAADVPAAAKDLAQ